MIQKPLVIQSHCDTFKYNSLAVHYHYMKLLIKMTVSVYSKMHASKISH